MQVNHVQLAENFSIKPIMAKKQTIIKNNRSTKDCFCKTTNTNPGFGATPSVKITKSILDCGDTVYQMFNKNGLGLMFSTCGAAILAILVPNNNKYKLINLTNNYNPDARIWDAEIVENGIMFSIDNPDSVYCKDKKNSKAIITFSFDDPGKDEIKFSHKILSNNQIVLPFTIYSNFDYYKRMLKEKPKATSKKEIVVNPFGTIVDEQNMWNRY